MRFGVEFRFGASGIDRAYSVYSAAPTDYELLSAVQIAQSPLSSNPHTFFRKQILRWECYHSIRALNPKSVEGQVFRMKLCDIWHTAVVHACRGRIKISNLCLGTCNVRFAVANCVCEGSRIVETRAILCLKKP